MASKPKQPPGPPMTLGNMRELGVRRLLVSCLNPECLHGGLLDVSAWPAETAVPSFIPAWSVATAAASALTSARTGRTNRRDPRRYGTIEPYVPAGRDTWPVRLLPAPQGGGTVRRY